MFQVPKESQVSVFQSCSPKLHISEASLLLYPEQGRFYMAGLLVLRITPNLEGQTTTTTQGHGRAIAVYL